MLFQGMIIYLCGLLFRYFFQNGLRNVNAGFVNLGLYFLYFSQFISTSWYNQRLKSVKKNFTQICLCIIEINIPKKAKVFINQLQNLQNKESKVSKVWKS